MRAAPSPRLHLFVCANRREGSPLGPGCGERGDALYDALKAEVARAPAWSREIWVTKTHCLGICPKRGATVARYPGATPSVPTSRSATSPRCSTSQPTRRPSATSRHDWDAIERELGAIEELQTQKVLDLARRLKPGLTLEDVQNPHDFPELDDPDWHYADGILTGMKSVTSALRALAACGRRDRAPMAKKKDTKKKTTTRRSRNSAGFKPARGGLERLQGQARRRGEGRRGQAEGRRAKGKPLPPLAPRRRRGRDARAEPRTRLDDELSFHRMMSGVTPLDSGAKTRIPMTADVKPGAQRVKAAEVKARAAREAERRSITSHPIVDDVARFEVTDDGNASRAAGSTPRPISCGACDEASLPVDGRLDLHGLTATQAQEKLVEFLRTMRGAERALRARDPRQGRAHRRRRGAPRRDRLVALAGQGARARGRVRDRARRRRRRRRALRRAAAVSPSSLERQP